MVTDANTSSSTITVPSDVTDASLDASSLLAGSSVTLPSGDITVNATTPAGVVSVAIPGGTTITASGTWDGVINLPQVTVSYTAPTSDSGYTSASAVGAIEIGANNTPLTFDTPVKLTFAGQGGKGYFIGWSQAGTFYKITAQCDSASTSTVAGIALASGSDCKFDSGVSGSDLVVWTRHFSVFVTYTQTAVSNNNNNNGGGGGGGGGGSYYNPYTITVNGGATQTASPNVTLSLTAIAGMNRMWISNDSSFASSTGTGWIPFQATYPWTLTSGSGNKTVYVEFTSASSTVSAGSAEASITLTVGGGTSGTSLTTGSGTSGSLRAAQMQLLNLLITQLQTLLRQAQAQGMTLTPAETAYLNAGVASPMLSAITRDLTIGSTGVDVSTLQTFLISQAKGSAASALGAAGATGHFGSLTRAALAEYQKAVGIKPASGYFGSLTRAYLKSAGL